MIKEIQLIPKHLQIINLIINMSLPTLSFTFILVELYAWKIDEIFISIDKESIEKKTIKN